MARRPTQYGTAHVKQRDAVRPLLVLLTIAAGGILLFLWLQKDTADPVVVVAEEAAPTASAPAPASGDKPVLRSAADELEDWWFDAEGKLLEAFEGLKSARDGSCEDLEYALTDLGTLSPPREQPVRAPFSAVMTSLDRALAGCRAGNQAIVDGSGRSAHEQLKALTGSLRTYGLPPSSLLSDV